MILENRLHITIKLYLCGFEKIFNKMITIEQLKETIDANKR